MLTNIFSSILSTSFTASLVITVVIIARFLLKKSPKIFSYVLWAVVLFRLVCPVTFESDFAIIPSDRPVEIYNNFVEVDEVPSDMDFLPQGGIINFNQPAQSSTLIDIDTNIVTEIENNNSVVGGDITTNDKLSLMEILSYIWLVGVISMFCFGVREFVKLHKSLIGCTRWKNSEYGNNIYLCDYIKSPFVMGIFKAKIYIPSNIINRDLNYIISHEKHHIKRLDHLTRIIAFITLALHWFNPLVWIAFVLSGKDMELSCDEYVLGNNNYNNYNNNSVDIRAEYSQALLYFACNLTNKHKLIAITPHAFGESGSTKERIKNIMTYKKTAVWLSCLLACIVGFSSIALASEKTVEVDEDITFVDTTLDIIEEETAPTVVETIVETVVQTEIISFDNIFKINYKNEHEILNNNYIKIFSNLVETATKLEVEPEQESNTQIDTFEIFYQDDTIRKFEISNNTLYEFVDDKILHYTLDTNSLNTFNHIMIPDVQTIDFLKSIGYEEYAIGYSNNLGNPYSNEINELMENITSIKLTYDSNDIYNAFDKLSNRNTFDDSVNLSEIVIKNQDYIDYIARTIYNSTAIGNSIYSVPGGLDFEIEFTFDDGNVLDTNMNNGIIKKSIEPDDINAPYIDFIYIMLNATGYQFFEELMLNGSVNGLGDPTEITTSDTYKTYGFTNKVESVVDDINLTLVDQNGTLIKNTSVLLWRKFDTNEDNTMYFVTDNNGELQGEFPNNFTTGEYVLRFITTDSYGRSIDRVQFIQEITTENANSLTITVPYTHENIENYTLGTNFKPLDIYIKDSDGNPIVNALVNIKKADDDAYPILPNRDLCNYAFSYTNDEGCAKFTSNIGENILECIVDGEIVLTENISLEDVATELEFIV